MSDTQYYHGVEQEMLLGSRREPPPLSAEDQRSRAVEMKLRELAAEHGLDMAHPENWGATEARLRDKLLDLAEEAVPGSKPITLAGPKEFQFDGDPLESVQAAKQAHAEAQSALDAAQEVHDRALAQLAKAEQAVADHDNLDAEIEAWNVQQLKENRTTDLPYGFRTRLTERAHAKDRFDHAKAACARLERELSEAQVTAQQAERVLKAAASAYIVRDAAASLVEDLRICEQEAVRIRSILLSLGAAWLPGLHGPMPLPPSITTAINTPIPIAEIDPKAVEVWRQRHADTLALAELEGEEVRH
jgi:hypothetical protein